MSKKDDHIWEMIEFTSSEVSIECGNDGCDNSDQEYQMEDFEACKIFYKKGWRIIDESVVMCPSCAKKHKK